MLKRYQQILDLIPSTSKVFMTLANEREPEHFDNGGIVDVYHSAYNCVLEQIASDNENVILIDVRNIIKSKEELFDLNHLRREVYFRMYEAIAPHLTSWSPPA